MELEDLTNDQLVAECKKWRGKIDGPENNGRVTSHGSYSLDYWMDMEEDCLKEMKRRGLTAND